MWLGMWWDAWVRPVARLHWLAPEALAWVPCAPPSCTLLAPPVGLSHSATVGVAGRARLP
jgi:hypothetical protein